MLTLCWRAGSPKRRASVTRTHARSVLALAEALWQSPRATTANACPTSGTAATRPTAHESRTTRLVVGGAAVGALLGIAGFQLSFGPARAEHHPCRPRAEQVEVASTAQGRATPVASHPRPKPSHRASRSSARRAAPAKVPTPRWTARRGQRRNRTMQATRRSRSRERGARLAARASERH